MSRFLDLLDNDAIRKLNNIKTDCTGNDKKIAGIIFSNLREEAMLQGLRLKLDGKKIIGVRVYHNGRFFMAKPIIQNNRLIFYYKKKYYDGEEVLGVPVNDYINKLR